MAEGSTEAFIKANTLPKMTMTEVKERAEKIFHARGRPPYAISGLSKEENEILSEQVYYWLPHFVEKSKEPLV